MQTYKEVDIQKLDFPDNIRERQGMFGSDGKDASILLREVIDNSIDVVLKGLFKGKQLVVKVYTGLDKDYHVVIDNGIGMPVYVDKDYDDDRPVIVDLLSKINVGSNFKRSSYSIGMNGVGQKLTNALSEEFTVLVNLSKKDKKTLPKDLVKRGKNIFYIKFNKGILEGYGVTDDLSCINLTDEVKQKVSDNLEDFGNITVFKPDLDVLESTKASYNGYSIRLLDHFSKFDTKGIGSTPISFTINDKKLPAFNLKDITDSNDKYVGVDGNGNEVDRVFDGFFEMKTEEKFPVKMFYSFAYSKDFSIALDGSVNLLKTPYGKHTQILTSAIVKALSKYSSIDIPAGYLKNGLRAFSLMFCIEPSFNSQDKTRLTRVFDNGYNEKEFISSLSDSIYKSVILKNKDTFDVIISRIIEYTKSMDRLSNLSALKSTVVMGDDHKGRAKLGDMSKVYECTTRDRSKAELYIVEGLSAAAGLIKHRDRKTQAVLPLKGKLINTASISEVDLVNNKEILAIINTMGCGVGSISDISKSRYGKIIIATDFDPDGYHISTLITSLFITHLPEVVESGMLYKIEAPFYAVKNPGRKSLKYYYMEEKDKIDFERSKVEKRKGLGSYTDKEIIDYLLGPKRRLIRVVNSSGNKVESVKLLYSSSHRRKLMIDRGIL